jgi:hypothetical protein
VACALAVGANGNVGLEPVTNVDVEFDRERPRLDEAQSEGNALTGK